MPLPVAHPQPRLSARCVGAPGEGRNSERSRRATALVLFPHGDARPGPWLLALACTCTYVTIRCLELGLI
jgi:hypothetical protein